VKKTERLAAGLGRNGDIRSKSREAATIDSQCRTA
jgi:hypothetical protein